MADQSPVGWSWESIGVALGMLAAGVGGGWKITSEYFKKHFRTSEGRRRADKPEITIPPGSMILVPPIHEGDDRRQDAPGRRIEDVEREWEQRMVLAFDVLKKALRDEFQHDLALSVTELREDMERQTVQLDLSIRTASQAFKATTDQLDQKIDDTNSEFKEHLQEARPIMNDVVRLKEQVLDLQRHREEDKREILGALAEGRRELGKRLDSIDDFLRSGARR